jgi:hypothetical protein
MSYKDDPVIILGAPRSGTNLLRDTLCQHPDVITWNCDEINPIWKYGSYSLSTDALPVSSLTSRADAYIKKQFRKLAFRNSGAHILEKTCANSLRPEYVHKLFPRARYIYIYRDGYDCASSALTKRSVGFDILYALRKLQYAPLLSLPYLFLDKLRQKPWGPNYIGILEDSWNLTPIEVVAKQWMKCNTSVLKFLESNINIEHYRLNYNDFVNKPERYLEEIMGFIDLNESFTFETKHVSNKSVGLSKRRLSPEDRTLIGRYIDSVRF